MTTMGIRNKKISKLTVCCAALFGIVLFCNNALATSSSSLYITGTLAECSYPQKRGGGACLERQNAKSCMNTTPFSPIGSGVTSEMCARGKEWCDRNDPSRKHSRCQNVDKGIVKNHQGYDYSAPCNTPIYAPCDGDSVYNAGSSTKPIKFTCEVCGKKYEYTFHHTNGTKGNGYYKKGQQIGWSGDKTGYPCHMHIEIRQGNLLMDPMNPSFDDVVCSCKNMPEKANRLECFDPEMLKDNNPQNVNPNPDPSGAGDADELGYASERRSSSIDPDCIFASVQASYVEAGCIFCAPFRIMFNTASKIAKLSYDTLANAVTVLVVVGFAIWLAIVILRFVSHFEIRDPRNMVKMLLHQAFKVLFVVLLLQGPLEQILELSINPVFSTGLKIAQLSSNIVDNSQESHCNIVVPGPNDEAVTTSSTETLGVAPEGGLPTEMGNSILCTIKSVQDQIIDIMVIARVSHCLAWEHSFLHLIPHFGYLLSAIGFFITGFLLLFGYSWLLVDCVLKLAVTVALLPAALGGWPFKVTSQYIKKVWSSFVEAVFTFIFLSLVIMIIATIAKSYATDIFSPEVKNSGVLMWYTVGACKLMFLCFLGWAVLGETKTFTKDFTQGIAGSSAPAFHKDIGATTGGAAAAAGKSVAKNYVAPVAKGVAKGAYTVARENASHLARKAKMAVYNKYGGGAGGGALGEGSSAGAIGDGNNVGGYLTEGGENGAEDNEASLGTKIFSGLRKAKYGVSSAVNKGLDKLHVNENSWFGRRWIVQDLNKLNDALHLRPGQSTFTQDASGNILQTTTVENADGSRTVTKIDDFATVKTHISADGKETVLSVEHKAAAKGLMDKNGEIDQAKLRAIQQNSMLAEQEKAMIIATAIHNKRMGNYIGGQLDGSIKSRQVSSSVDVNGNMTITINQINSDGTKSTFITEVRGDRAMNSVETIDGKGKGMAYATDGIVQKVTDIIDEDTRKNTYSVAEKYHSWTNRPIHTDGSVADVIGRDRVLFSDEDLQAFGQQVAQDGLSTAFGSFTSFK